MATILETARKAGRFNTLVSAIEAAGLAEALSGPGPFTVFAPSDEAFRGLPTGTVEALLQDKARLTAILKYHVVPGKVMASDVMNISSATTLQGESAGIDTSRGVMIAGAKVMETDIVCDNGVIHVIDRVMMPPSERRRAA